MLISVEKRIELFRGYRMRFPVRWIQPKVVPDQNSPGFEDTIDFLRRSLTDCIVKNRREGCELSNHVKSPVGPREGGGVSLNHVEGWVDCLGGTDAGCLKIDTVKGLGEGAPGHQPKEKSPATATDVEDLPAGQIGEATLSQHGSQHALPLLDCQEVSDVKCSVSPGRRTLVANLDDGFRMAEASQTPY